MNEQRSYVGRGYLSPEGCGFVSAEFSRRGTDQGMCVCAPEWGHNATVWEKYKFAQPEEK